MSAILVRGNPMPRGARKKSKTDEKSYSFINKGRK